MNKQKLTNIDMCIYYGVQYTIHNVQSNKIKVFLQILPSGLIRWMNIYLG